MLHVTVDRSVYTNTGAVTPLPQIQYDILAQNLPLDQLTGGYYPTIVQTVTTDMKYNHYKDYKKHYKYTNLSTRLNT